MNRCVAVVIGCAMAVLFLPATFKPVVQKPVVQQDGLNYHAYLHSIVMDHDIDYSDAYWAAGAARLTVTDVLVGPEAAHWPARQLQPVGSALLAVTFYLVAPWGCTYPSALIRSLGPVGTKPSRCTATVCRARPLHRGRDEMGAQGFDGVPGPANPPGP